MKTIATTLTAIIATAIGAGATIVPSRPHVGNFADMAPYVYPDNAPRTVERPAFSPDGLTYLALSDDGKRITRHDTKSGSETETVMDISNTRENSIEKIESFTLSPDGSKLLIATAEEPIYRRSVRAAYYVYELRTRILRPLSQQHPTQRDPLFSPDGRMVAFVAADNNIWLKKIDYDTETAVTNDGAVDRVINGVADWVYEEEFTTTCSMAWAPDCMTLCYLKYNETEVPAYSFTLYEGTCDPMKQYALYPGRFTYKYPVAGETNSTVTLHSYDVDNRKTKNLPLPDSRIEYIPRITYGGASSDRLMVVTLDRSQTRMEVYSLNPRSGVAKSVLTEQDNAWLPSATYEDMTFEDDGFVVLSARSGWTHAYRYTYAGALDGQITSGDFDVTDYYGKDARGNRYVRSTATGSINRVVSRIDIKGVMKHLSPATGTASAWFAPGMGHYAITYSTSATPPVVTLYAAPSDKKARVLEENTALASRYASAPQREFITVTTDEGIDMNAYIIKPAGFDPSRRYPLIIHQYSGPGSQEVADRWRPDWTQYAAMKGYVVLCVDPRGTGFKGRAWETAVYKDLGHYETIDLQGAARWAMKQRYVDPARIGITGWSYGGYETLMAITTGDSPFACAVAIAPVTDWRYYDTVYAERFMLTPRENAGGYRESAPVSHAAALDIPLLIMHGTSDDNVHLMNTMQYVSVLQQAGKWCDMFLYPDMNHSINGCDARLNVYSKMLDYFNKNL